MNYNKNNTNPLEPAKVVKSVSTMPNGKFDIIALSRNSEKDERIFAKSEFIAVIPFDRNDSSKIANIYAVQFNNHATDQTDVTLLIDAIDSERDDTVFDAVGRVMLEEAGINLDDLGLTEDDIFYLGPMTFSDPILAKFKCYAIDVTKVSRPDQPIEFTRTLAKSPFNKDDSEIVKIGFYRIVNGDFTDVTILAGAFLLVSYFQ